MSNWKTAVETIKARANKPSATEDDRIKRALCDTIALHRREGLTLNQGRLALQLQAGVETYGPGQGLPADIVSIVGVKGKLDYAGDSTDRHDVWWVSNDKMDELRTGIITDGTPCYWTFWAGKLELWPPSDLSTHVFRARYRRDPGTPFYVYQGSAWAFFKPSGQAMDDLFTNEWFDLTQGFRALTHHAEWTLWTGPWQATNGQDQRALQSYTEALAGLQEITGMQTAARQIEPYTEGWE